MNIIQSCVLIACIEIALSKMGRGRNKPAFYVFIVNHKLKRDLQWINLNDIISYVKIKRQMIKIVSSCKLTTPKTSPRYLFNLDKSNTCLNFKH